MSGTSALGTIPYLTHQGLDHSVAYMRAFQTFAAYILLVGVSKL